MKFDHAAASLRHVCKHKEVVTATGLSHVRILQIGGSHSSWNIKHHFDDGLEFRKDYVFMKHMTVMKLCSSF